MYKVSVVMPCYNYGAFLPEALESLYAQTFTDFEIVLVDDGSTDSETVRQIEWLARSGMCNLQVVRTANRGVSAARNQGISLARGEYILPLDADDRIGPEYLAQATAIMEARAEVAIVYCERRFFGEKHGVAPLPAYDPRRLLVENLICPAALFRKNAWKEVGGYNEKMLHGWEDWDFWVALAQLKGEVVKLPGEMFFYRVRSTSRDHSLRFFRKLHMYLLIMRRNWRPYLHNFPYVTTQLIRIHLLRSIF